MFRVISSVGKRLHAPSPAMTVALVALFVALGGGAYAAIKLPANSVGTKQLKRGAVVVTKLANNAVTSSKVKDGSLLAKDFKAGQLPAGPRGPQGPKGDTGPQGPPAIIDRAIATGSPSDAGGDSANIVVSNATFTNPANTVDWFVGKATYTPPSMCSEGGGGFPQASFDVVLDGSQRVGGAVFGVVGAPTTQSFAGAVSVGLAPGPHTIGVTGSNNCQGAGQQGTISMEIDTVAIR